MSRALRNVFGGGGLLASVLWLGAGCSGDASDGDDSADGSSGDGGSGNDVAGGSSASGGSGGGSAGGSASGDSASGGSASGGSAANAATYTAARACELFGRASCGKATECGLVLAQAGNMLICAQCDALSLGIVQQQCLQDAPGDKDAAAVDRCVASIGAQPCAQACADLNANDCAVFGQLTSDSTRAVVCDVRCVQ
ncbi:MAG: hypothetical protein ABI895_07440 [Deltaproteobacteria bacterium]